jgi:hypothetical protein
MRTDLALLLVAALAPRVAHSGNSKCSPRGTLGAASDDFELPGPWGQCEELVGPCYASGVGGATRVCGEVAHGGTCAARVWANKGASTQSNHLIHNVRLPISERDGLVRMAVWAYVDPANSRCQTGPEFSLQLTTDASKTVIMGMQYRPHEASRWAVWGNTNPLGNPAGWVPVNSDPQLEPGRWYRLELSADFSASAMRYQTLLVSPPVAPSLTVTPVSLIVEARNFQSAAEVTLEAENDWTALAANTTTSIEMAGRCGLPTDATAVEAAAVNLTVTEPTAAGDLTLFPAGSGVPLASAINYAAGQTRANNAVVAAGSGAIGLRVDQASGCTHAILDVNGYFSAGTLFPVTPCRILDTRTRTQCRVYYDDMSVDRTPSMRGPSASRR